MSAPASPPGRRADPAARRRLAWRARRGMLELDMVLMSFIENSYNTMKEEELVILERLLEWPDHQLQAVLLRGERPADPAFTHVVEHIRRAVAP
ncbi:succinate dehydrogenase assembly factor 2 [Ectothiorhodospiraceae bacterium 2226]|nr:succinate dehydrogenase assembly factor 2 [Ectothiorhodospiraceae bacterium 2226]